MPEASVPMDIVKVESEKGEAVTGRTPLGLEGMETKAREVAAADDKNRAEDLIPKAAFMEAYAKHLTDKWIFHMPALNEEKERLERQLKTQAKRMSGKSFLMDLGDASNVGQPQREKGVPNADNVAQLALAHSVVAGAIANKEELQDVQTGRLAIRYGQLRERLETYVAGGSFKKPEVKDADPKPAKVEAKNSKGSEGAAGSNKIDENLGSLETQEEKDLVIDIQAALANGSALGFLLNRKEAGGKAHIRYAGFTIWSPTNIDESHATTLYEKDIKNFPLPEYGIESINYGDSQLRIINEFDKLNDPTGESSKLNPVRVGQDKAVLALHYQVRGGDSLGRNPVLHMYLAVPRELGERIYASCERHNEDDPTRAVKILGHALGEDLDINWSDKGVDQYANLDVERVRLKRS